MLDTQAYISLYGKVKNVFELNSRRGTSRSIHFSTYAICTAECNKYIHVLVKMSSKNILIWWNLAKTDSSEKYVTVFLRANAYD